MYSFDTLHKILATLHSETDYNDSAVKIMIIITYFGKSTQL